MNRNYSPLSRAMRVALFACAVTMTTVILVFIHLLASDSGSLVAQAVQATIPIAAHG